eukprot:scaffold18208_cov182-Amphora_coffeaeformis.AAC.5
MKVFRRQSRSNSDSHLKRGFLLNRSASLKSLLSFASTSPTEDSSFSSLNESWCNASLNNSAAWDFLEKAPAPQRVVFDEEPTKYYDSPWTIICNESNKPKGRRYHQQEKTFASRPTSEDTEIIENLIKLVEVTEEDIWYSRSSVLKFRNDAQGHAHVLMKQRAPKDGSYDPVAVPSWSQAIWMAYEDLHEASSKEQMQAVMSCRSTTPEACVGLEKWAAPGVQTARTRQQQALFEAIEWAQAANKSPRELRRISRLISRGSRSFAVYIARSIAGNSSNV